MGLGVGGVRKLAGDEAAGDGGGQLVGLLNGPLHTLSALGQHQLCAIGLDQLAALHAHGVRHDDDQLVAPGRCHGGQANARVAGGGLDEGCAGLQSPGPLGIVNNALGDPVLHGTGGVEILQLGQDLGFQLLFLFNMGQLQQRGTANQLVSRGVDLRHMKNFLPLCENVWLCSPSKSFPSGRSPFPVGEG